MPSRIAPSKPNMLELHSSRGLCNQGRQKKAILWRTRLTKHREACSQAQYLEIAPIPSQAIHI